MNRVGIRLLPRYATRVWILAVLALVSATPAEGLPLYASREGKTCVSCHVEPNGGGMRNDFGFHYGKNRHSMEAETRWGELNVDPQLNDWIRLGLDTRVMYVASHANGGPTLETSTFFPMQGQLRVAITPHDRLTIVGVQGIVVDAPGFPTPYVARELYGLIQAFPYNLYLQVGRFRVPFGMRQDDHTSFVRHLDFLSFDSQKEDAGVAIGSVGTHGFGQVAFTNGNTPFAERAQTVAGKVGWTSKWFQAAASGFHRYSDAFAFTIDRWSGYASATYGPITLLGEYAGGTNDAVFGATNLEAAFAEVDYRVSRGVSVRAKVDWLNRNKAFSNDEQRRYLIETDLTPMPFTDVKLSYRYYDDDLGGISKEYLAMLFLPF